MSSLSPTENATETAAARPGQAAAELPQVRPGLPPPGTYRLRLDRCALEVRTGPLAARFTPASGELHVPDGPDAPVELALTVRSRPTRVSRPLTRRALAGPLALAADRHPEIRFTAEVHPAGPGALRLVGEVTVRELTVALPATARVVRVDTEAVVLSCRGRVDRHTVHGRHPRRLSVLAAALVRRRLTVELAGDFTR
ncbi:YceI family protein [Solihabitans fulvus]|nr:YceI family protein [Solihabitans fulvus]